MIHNTKEDWMEFVAWLRKHRIYNPNASAEQMSAMHTVYWTMKDEQEGQAGVPA
jgi:hypothetical protein